MKFDIVRINQNNLDNYKSSKYRFKKISASIMEEFFYNNTPYKLKAHINPQLKEMGISYESTYKYQLKSCLTSLKSKHYLKEFY
ncbi:hypothetical protein BHO_0900029 (plasmid) [Borrelia hermsii YBT]|uniref:Uncharacterized protein n=1 Tax=Borrelia hermsii YBT TaxID=1313295 RepID=W5T0N6_BORHE|nr:hypothetical protein BHO_0900029 [Borrelia hermsii YBT]